MKTPQQTRKIFENNFAFIDSQNLHLAISGQGWRLDFAKFRIYLKNKFKVTQAFIFIGYVDRNEKLYTYLQKSGYILIYKPTTVIRGETKGNCDAELVLHTMIEYQNYDKAVIVSGDGDFRCLVEYLLTKDKLKKLIIPNKYKYSCLFKDFLKTDKVCFLNKDRSQIEDKKRKA